MKEGRVVLIATVAVLLVLAVVGLAQNRKPIPKEALLSSKYVHFEQPAADSKYVYVRMREGDGKVPAPHWETLVPAQPVEPDATARKVKTCCCIWDDLPTLMIVLITVVALVWCSRIIFDPKYPIERTQWAFATAGLVIGYWFKGVTGL